MDHSRSVAANGEFPLGCEGVPERVALSWGSPRWRLARCLCLAFFTAATGCAVLPDGSTTESQWTSASAARATAPGNAENLPRRLESTPWEAVAEHRGVVDPSELEVASSKNETPEVEMRFVASATGNEAGPSPDPDTGEPFSSDDRAPACTGELPGEPPNGMSLAGWYEVSGSLITNGSHRPGISTEGPHFATPAVYFDRKTDADDNQSPRPSEAPGGRVPEEVAAPETGDDPTEESPLVPLTPVTRLTVDIRPKGADLPIDHARDMFLSRGMVVYSRDSGKPANLHPVIVASPEFCHYPLYFEQFNLERHGYSHGIAQPFVSAAHFFGRLPALPYLVAVDRPCQCMATSGPYGPGEYCPCPHVLPPWDVRAALFEAGLVTGLVFIIP